MSTMKKARNNLSPSLRAQNSKSKVNKGFIMLLSVLVLGAVGLAIAASLLLLGVGFSKSSSALQESNKAKGLVNACTEHALNELRKTFNYLGSEIIPFGPNDSCTVGAIAGGCEFGCTVQVSATAGNAVRKAEVVVTNTRPQVIVSSWQEIE